MLDFDSYMEKQPIIYLVYYYKGKIKVKMGKRYSRTFHEMVGDKVKSSPWHTGIPDDYMECNSKNKVLCYYYSDVPKAKEMIRNNLVKRLDEYSSISLSTIQNITKFLEETYDKCTNPCVS